MPNFLFRRIRKKFKQSNDLLKTLFNEHSHAWAVRRRGVCEWVIEGTEYACPYSRVIKPQCLTNTGFSENFDSSSSRRSVNLYLGWTLNLVEMCSVRIEWGLSVSVCLLLRLYPNANRKLPPSVIFSLSSKIRKIRLLDSFVTFLCFTVFNSFYFLKRAISGEECLSFSIEYFLRAFKARKTIPEQVQISL